MGGQASKVLPGLLHGGCNQLEEPDFFTSRGITHVLSVCEKRPEERPGLDVRHIEIEDLPDAKLSTHFKAMVEYIHQSRVGGGTCFVHCAAGVSRSSTAVCAYLITTLGLNYDEAICFVRTRRKIACPNDGFKRQLRHFIASGEAKALGAYLREAYPDGEGLTALDRQEVQSALAVLAKSGPIKDTSDNVLALLASQRSRMPMPEGWGLTWVPHEHAKKRKTTEADQPGAAKEPVAEPGNHEDSAHNAREH